MSSPPRITPRTLKGFRDYLPDAMLARERLIDTARQVYRSYGYSPIDTPALEYYEILAGKGGEETTKQMFRFQQGKRDVAMRFDLTVPLARFVAQHIGKLGTPFKRYHIAPVWRGEKPQEGRYREFMQCDFDTIGTTSIVADIETVAVIHDLMLALGVDDFVIRVNHRGVLGGLLDKLGLAAKSAEILRALDKLPKIGPDAVAGEMTSAVGIDQNNAEKILQLARIEGSNDEVLRQVQPLIAGSEMGEAGVESLTQLCRGAHEAGVSNERLVCDMSIARGLDYYTGVVFETFLTELPGIGSVCSGGRYDDLAGLYTKERLPGVGASLGLDRLLAALEKLGHLEAPSAPAPVLVTYFQQDARDAYLGLAAHLRAAGLSVELYPDPKKLGQQLKYADRRGFRVALIAGSRELEAGTCQVKDLSTGESQEISTDDNARQVAAAIFEILATDVAGD